MLLETIVNQITNLEAKLNGSSIVIFGTGKGGKFTDFVLRTLGYRTKYFVDNNDRTWGNQLQGIPIQSPKVLLEEKDQIFILISSMYFEEIFNQLVQMGFESERHFRCVINEENDVRKNEMQRHSHFYLDTRVGRYTYGYEKFDPHGLVEEIGSFCSINSTAYVGENHPVRYVSTSPAFYHEDYTRNGGVALFGFAESGEVPNINEISNNEKVRIGHDVWIGAHAVLLPSIKIGNGAIIGAGAVVTKDVPDYAIVAGVPAKVLRYRFSPEEIKRLNEIKWWDWPEEKLMENAKYFMNNKEFFERFCDKQLSGDPL